MDSDLRIKEIAIHYGFTNQANMLCEESAEFMVALNKLRRGDDNAYENVKEEVADVLIMARQLRLLLGSEDIDKIIDAKLNRQIQRIKEDSIMETFKIGDKVKLKDGLIIGNRYGGTLLYRDMKQWFDGHKTAVVTDTSMHVARFSDDGYYYSFEMLEKI